MLAVSVSPDECDYNETVHMIEYARASMDIRTVALPNERPVAPASSMYATPGTGKRCLSTVLGVGGVREQPTAGMHSLKSNHRAHANSRELTTPPPDDTVRNERFFAPLVLISRAGRRGPRAGKKRRTTLLGGDLTASRAFRNTGMKAAEDLEALKEELLAAKSEVRVSLPH